jgi:hypothetical protein
LAASAGAANSRTAALGDFGTSPAFGQLSVKGTSVTAYQSTALLAHSKAQGATKTRVKTP